MTLRTRGASHGHESRNSEDDSSCCTVRMTMLLKRWYRERGRRVVHVSERWRKDTVESLAWSTIASSTSVGSCIGRGELSMKAAHEGWEGILCKALGPSTGGSLTLYTVVHNVTASPWPRRSTRFPGVLAHGQKLIEDIPEQHEERRRSRPSHRESVHPTERGYKEVQGGEGVSEGGRLSTSVRTRWRSRDKLEGTWALASPSQTTTRTTKAPPSCPLFLSP